MCFHRSLWIMGIDMQSAEMLVNPIDRCETAVSHASVDRCGNKPHLSRSCYIVRSCAVHSMLGLDSRIFSR